MEYEVKAIEITDEMRNNLIRMINEQMSDSTLDAMNSEIHRLEYHVEQKEIEGRLTASSKYLERLIEALANRIKRKHCL
jgi:hypothetical protein